MSVWAACVGGETARESDDDYESSGPNADYLFGLADAMRAMGVGPREDPHLFQLKRSSLRCAMQWRKRKLL